MFFFISIFLNFCHIILYILLYYIVMHYFPPTLVDWRLLQRERERQPESNIWKAIVPVTLLFIIIFYILLFFIIILGRVGFPPPKTIVFSWMFRKGYALRDWRPLVLDREPPSAHLILFFYWLHYKITSSKTRKNKYTNKNKKEDTTKQKWLYVLNFNIIRKCK